LLLIGEWALPTEGSLGSRLEAAVAEGFDGVELVWCDSGSILTTSSTLEVAKELRRGNIEIGSLCTEPLSLDCGGPGTFAGNIIKMIETAALLAAEVVVVNLGRLDYDSANRILETASRAAQSAGVSIAIENGLRGDFLMNAEALSRLTVLGSCPIDVHLDVGNATATGTINAWLAQDRRPLRSLHLKDWNLASGSPSACGDGDVRWEELWKALEGRLPAILTVEHSRRALGKRALTADLASRIRTWAESGLMERAKA
jgi:sugar phosphate isomerase/epimerase